MLFFPTDRSVTNSIQSIILTHDVILVTRVKVFCRWTNEHKASRMSTKVCPRHIIDELKTQFEAQSEVAVLAQANQLPNPAMSFSETTET